MTPQPTDYNPDNGDQLGIVWVEERPFPPEVESTDEHPPHLCPERDLCDVKGTGAGRWYRPRRPGFSGV